MNFAGRPLQRSGSAPVAPDPPVRVNFGGPLSGIYVQAQGNAVLVSWNGSDWLIVPVGPPSHFRVSAPFVLVRSSAGAARYSVLGILA
jgi:hypothetical protein